MSAALRARSPNIMDDIVKRPPPSPSDKAPPQKKLDVKSQPASEEPTPKAGSPVIAPKEKSDLKEAEKKDEPSRQDVLDMEVFGQILELDDGDRSFVSSMVNEYFDQVDVTFDEMDQAMQTKDLKRISQLGHFLKGSSAALGVKQVSMTCEKIQNTAKGIPTEKTLEEVMSLLKRVKEEYNAAKRWLLRESCQTSVNHTVY